MVDYNELRKKFQAKKPVKKDAGPNGGRSARAVKAQIQREYELKKAELTGGAPMIRRGPLFYGMLVLMMVVVGSLVVPQLLNGTLTLGKKRIERKALQARKSMDALSVALGRYRFHVGEYPSTEEGLFVLAYRKPNEIRRVRRQHPGWDGPYINHVVKDPWGNDYYYETRPEGGNPILYSKGPNGRAGDDDDVLPEQLSFDEPFRDTSWTNHWAPCELRGIVVAPDEETKESVKREMQKYD